MPGPEHLIYLPVLQDYVFELGDYRVSTLGWFRQRTEYDVTVIFVNAPDQPGLPYTKDECDAEALKENYCLIVL